MRILGIDPGEARIGLAISDPLGITAQGLETFEEGSGVDFLQFLAGIIRDYEVKEIVVGNPLSLSGAGSASSRRAGELAEALGRAFALKVTLWDERLSSEEARRVLRGARAGKGAVDRVSATIILQSYLDYLRRDTEPRG